ncbi:hypothetical protein MKW98_022563 [Papaver atlanticum]|uniref:RNase H type-1 domain-containing protein n=1 Tax=Papaver atlanticum TaxID=357466 RepID=A0AAD4SMC7_9MAGN|nr:hypothetical protein MKW98_022563 [Papaver atlanticum]
MRDCLGSFIYAESGGIGVASNFVAEIFAIVRTVEWAVQSGKVKLVMQSDSKTVISMFQFQSRCLPWYIKQDGLEAVLGSRLFYSIMLIERSISQLASLQKKGSHLSRGQIRHFHSHPYDLQSS